MHKRLVYTISTVEKQDGDRQMKILKNTQVRLLTTNGGDTIATLEADYRPSFPAFLSHKGGYFTVEAARIKSLQPIPLQVAA